MKGTSINVFVFVAVFVISFVTTGIVITRNDRPQLTPEVVSSSIPEVVSSSTSYVSKDISTDENVLMEKMYISKDVCEFVDSSLEDESTITDLKSKCKYYMLKLHTVEHSMMILTAMKNNTVADMKLWEVEIFSRMHKKVKIIKSLNISEFDKHSMFKEYLVECMVNMKCDTDQYLFIQAVYLIYSNVYEYLN